MGVLGAKPNAACARAVSAIVSHHVAGLHRLVDLLRGVPAACSITR
jgi:hypothetical protein